MRNSRWAFYLTLLMTAVFLLAAAFLLDKAQRSTFPADSQSREITAEPEDSNPENAAPKTTKEESARSFESVQPEEEPPDRPEPAIQGSFSLTIPFLSQAPYAVWDPLHEEACEEASLIMVRAFYDQREEIPIEQGESEIQALVAYESDNGFGPSITLQELAKIALDYSGMKNSRIVTSPTINGIKEEILAKRPVIIPAAGKILPNPNFRNGGPNYHMLVIKGFTETGFITNDPGTRKGNDFFYKYGDLMNAIHDWDAGNILNGQKAYLVFDQ